MHVEFAAHVDHGVAHTSETAKIALGLGCAVVAVAIVLSGGTAAVALVGAAQAGTMVGAAGAASVAGGIGMDVGGIIDKYLPKAIVERIKTGMTTVLLGPDKKEAARAHSSTKLTGHTYVFEGSITTFLGKEFAPMSRRQDRTECGGEITEHIKTIIVGGDPSRLGKDIKETESGMVTFMKYGFAALGVVNAAREGVGKAIVAAAPTAIGAVNDDAGTVASGLSGIKGLRSPAGLLERAGQINDAAKGAFTGVQTGTGMVTGAP